MTIDSLSSVRFGWTSDKVNTRPVRINRSLLTVDGLAHSDKVRIKRLRDSVNPLLRETRLVGEQLTQPQEGVSVRAQRATRDRLATLRKDLLPLYQERAALLSAARFRFAPVTLANLGARLKRRDKVTDPVDLSKPGFAVLDMAPVRKAYGLAGVTQAMRDLAAQLQPVLRPGTKPSVSPVHHDRRPIEERFLWAPRGDVHPLHRDGGDPLKIDRSRPEQLLLAYFGPQPALLPGEYLKFPSVKDQLRLGKLKITDERQQVLPIIGDSFEPVTSEAPPKLPLTGRNLFQAAYWRGVFPPRSDSDKMKTQVTPRVVFPIAPERFFRDSLNVADVVVMNNNLELGGIGHGAYLVPVPSVSTTLAERQGREALSLATGPESLAPAFVGKDLKTYADAVARVTEVSGTARDYRNLMRVFAGSEADPNQPPFEQIPVYL